MASTCPVCQNKIDADETAFAYHVSRHFDQDESGDDAGGGWMGGDLWQDDVDGFEWEGGPEEGGGGTAGLRLRGGGTEGESSRAGAGGESFLSPPNELRGLRKKLSSLLLGSPKGKERADDERGMEENLRGGRSGVLSLFRRPKAHASCPICSLDMDDLDLRGREVHVSAHLGSSLVLLPPPLVYLSFFICIPIFSTPPSGSPEEEDEDHGAVPFPPSSDGHDQTAASSSTAPASSSHRDKRDLTWSPINTPTTSLPSNMTPGLIPLLHSLLLSSPPTRSAILCRPLGTTHVASLVGYDTLWGCGYRNFQMATSSLLGAGLYTDVEGLAGAKIGDSGVGIATLQSWIEGAWAEGWDKIGKAQLKGRLKGQKKWIGTGDVWVGMMNKGIRCTLTDFPKTKSSEAVPSHILLQRWVVNYFNSDSSKPPQGTSKSAFDVVMQSQGQSIRLSDKFPLILQHHGHSRTIVGTETTKNGDTNLLLFDPAKTIPSNLRRLAIKDFNYARDLAASSSSSSNPNGSSSSISSSSKPSPPSATKDVVDLCGSSGDDDEEGADDEGKGRKRLGSMFGLKKDGKKKLKTDGKGEDSGKKREKFTGDVGDALKVFRVNLKTLKRNSEYQILSFSGEPLMPKSQRDKYKVVVSTIISH